MTALTIGPVRGPNGPAARAAYTVGIHAAGDRPLLVPLPNGDPDTLIVSSIARGVLDDNGLDALDVDSYDISGLDLTLRIDDGATAVMRVTGDTHTHTDTAAAAMRRYTRRPGVEPRTPPAPPHATTSGPRAPPLPHTRTAHPQAQHGPLPLSGDGCDSSQPAPRCPSSARPAPAPYSPPYQAPAAPGHAQPEPPQSRPTPTPDCSYSSQSPNRAHPAPNVAHPAP